MYVSHDPSKNITAALASAYGAAGIKSLVFFEDTAGRALGGYAAGVADAKFALWEANAAGQPSWAPIFAAVDFDVPDFAPGSTDPMEKLGPVGQYLKGFASVLGKGRTGVYGGYWAVTRAIAAGLASFGIQTIAWSGGLVAVDQVACLQNGAMLGGGTVDVEVIQSAKLLNLVAWTPGEANPSAPPPPPPVPASPVAWTQWPASVTLGYGSTAHVAVRVLQTALRNSGIYGVRGITPDGWFGNQTLTALLNFQFTAHLAQDGVGGRDTHAALVALNDL
jgi:peptidoglycan hydrolase-like protein with peptidoglycan-binding domain